MHDFLYTIFMVCCSFAMSKDKELDRTKSQREIVFLTRLKN